MPNTNMRPAFANLESTGTGEDHGVGYADARSRIMRLVTDAYGGRTIAPSEYSYILNTMIPDFRRKGFLNEAEAAELKTMINAAMTQGNFTIPVPGGIDKNGVITPGTETPAPVTGSPGPGPNPIVGGVPGTVFEEPELAQAGYLKHLGIGGTGRSVWQDWLANQFGPSYATFKGLAAQSPSASPMTWMGYLGDYSDPSFGIQKSRTAYKQALGMSPEEQRSWIERIGGMDDLKAMFNNVLRSAYAAPIARNMGNRFGDIYNQYLGETNAEQNPSSSFLEYLKSKYGLGAAGY